MGTLFRPSIASLFFLIPLSYSIDNDPFRAWEVVLWSGIALAIAARRSVKIKIEADFIVAVAYALILVLQQLFIDSGRVWFGAQYAAVFMAAILPSIVLRRIAWTFDEFERYFDGAIRLLAILVAANIFGGRFFGWGETYAGGVQDGRFFGYLGDSISPVIVLPLMYFLFERRFMWMLLMAACLVLTGGKAAILLLAAAPVLFYSTRFSPIIVIVLVSGLAAAAVMLDSLVANIVNIVQDSRVTSYSFNTRIISFEAGLRYFLESPVWGVGINQSMSYVGFDADIIAAQNGIVEYWPVYQVHNAFVRALSETGILGFGVLVFLCVILMGRSLTALRISRNARPSKCRSLVTACSLWTVLFIVTYQSTGWFEHGHPQFAWLLILAAVSSAGTRLLLHERRVTSRRFGVSSPAGGRPRIEAGI